jgi:hypothetical protein
MIPPSPRPLAVTGLAILVVIVLALLAGTPSALFAQQATAIQFDVDAAADVKPISRFIYGINQFHLVQDGMNGHFSNLTFNRLGGNRLTDYNWTNNASNAGNDYHFESDDYLVMGPLFKGVADSPGGACIPSIHASAQHNAALLLTIPINGFVSAHKLPTPNDVRKIPDYFKAEFRSEQPRKNAPFTLTPDPDSPIIYEDEFVNWVKTKYPYAESDPIHPIWFSLDNEPDLWQSTHLEVHPDPVTYAEVVRKNIDYAAAAKDVMPGTLIFGPVDYGWHGMQTLQDAPDGNGRDWLDFYLDQMAAAEKKAGKRLLDVLDVHYYPEATGNGVRIMGSPNNTPPVAAARVQATRSLWDPSFTETSWITEKSTHGPIRLLPLLQEKIAAHYPGTKLALTEYEFGGGDDISGAIAQADALGIFGVQGLFAAALWPGRHIPFSSAAFDMYRNFDGNNGSFGDISVKAQTSNIEDSAIYASKDSANPGTMVIVVINRTDQPQPTQLHLHNAGPFKHAQVFQFTSAAPKPQPDGDIPVNDGQTLDYTMPARSISTIQLTGG